MKQLTLLLCISVMTLLFSSCENNGIDKKEQRTESNKWVQINAGNYNYYLYHKDTAIIDSLTNVYDNKTLNVAVLLRANFDDRIKSNCIYQMLNDKIELKQLQGVKVVDYF